MFRLLADTMSALGGVATDESWVDGVKDKIESVREAGLPFTNRVSIAAVAVGQISGDAHLVVHYTSGAERRRLVVSAEDLSSSRSHVLTKLGLLTQRAKEDFRRQAESALSTMQDTRTVIERSGVHNAAFVWPTGDVSGDCNVLISLPKEYDQAGSTFRKRGTLEAWRQIPALVAGSPAVMLALCHAFSGPVVDFLQCEASMIQLVGKAGTFKSSLLEVVALIWGNDRLLWSGTACRAEEVALRHSATHLVLDDLRPDDLSSNAYAKLCDGIMRVADGQMRGRSGERPLTWRTPILSAANRTLDEMAIEARFPIDDRQAAARGRLIDVPLPNGRQQLFEHLQGGQQLELIKTLTEVACANQGVAAEAFVTRFLSWARSDAKGLRRWLSQRRDQYAAIASRRFGLQTDFALTRIHMKLGTTYAAGCLAIDFGILPWKCAELGNAIVACQNAHLSACALLQTRRPVISTNATVANIDPFLKLRRHIARHRDNLVDLRQGLLDPHSTHDRDRCPGYLNEGPDGELELLFSHKALLKICGGPTDVEQLKRQLKSQGILKPNKNRAAVKRSIFKGTRDERCHVIAIRAVGPLAEVAGRRLHSFDCVSGPQATAKPSSRRPKPEK